MKKLHILFLSSWYPTKVNPTNGDFVQRHADVVNSIHNVKVLHVCFHNENTVLDIRNTNEVEEFIYYVKKPNIPILKYLIKLILFVCYYFKGLKQIRKSGFEPNVIHVNVILPVGFIAYLFAKKMDIPYVISEHYSKFIRRVDSFNLFELQFIRFLAKKAKVVMPVSKSLRDAMIERGIKANYKVVTNSVNKSLFYVDSNKRKDGVLRFLHLSVIDDKIKNATAILRTAERLAKVRQNFELHIVSQVTNNKDYVAATPQIKIYNVLSHKEAAILMRSCDVYVQFSNYETFSIVLAEALACGNAVICTDCGGLCDDITPDLGELLPVGDEKRLYASMLAMIDNEKVYNPTLLSQFVQNNFSDEVVASEFDDVYQSLI